MTIQTFKRSVLAIPALIAVLAWSGCDTSDAPVASEHQSTTSSKTVQADPGVPIALDAAPALAKSFSLQSMGSLAGCRIAYDMSHNGASNRQRLGSPTGGNAYSVIFGDYTSRGATISVITSFTAAVLGSYDVLWLEEDWEGVLTAAEKTILQNYVSNGGSVIINGDDWGIFSGEPGSPYHAFGFGYTPGSAGGTTTNITVHPVTAGVTTVQFSSAVQALSLPGSAVSLVRNPTGTRTYISVLEYGAGRVAAVCDEFFINGVSILADNRVLGNNLIEWVCVTDVDIDIKPGGYPNSINCQNLNGTIAVAILTTPDFNALSVDHTTVRFEGAAERHSHQGVPTRHEEDVDGDGDTDLVLHFRMSETTLTCSSTVGHLTGLTYNDSRIRGSDSVNMVNQ